MGEIQGRLQDTAQDESSSSIHNPILIVIQNLQREGQKSGCEGHDSTPRTSGWRNRYCFATEEETRQTQPLAMTRFSFKKINTLEAQLSVFSGIMICQSLEIYIHIAGEWHGARPPWGPSPPPLPGASSRGDRASGRGQEGGGSSSKRQSVQAALQSLGSLFRALFRGGQAAAGDTAGSGPPLTCPHTSGSWAPSSRPTGSASPLAGEPQ